MGNASRICAQTLGRVSLPNRQPTHRQPTHRQPTPPRLMDIQMASRSRIAAKAEYEAAVARGDNQHVKVTFEMIMPAGIDPEEFIVTELQDKILIVDGSWECEDMSPDIRVWDTAMKVPRDKMNEIRHKFIQAVSGLTAEEYQTRDLTPQETEASGFAEAAAMRYMESPDEDIDTAIASAVQSFHKIKEQSYDVVNGDRVVGCVTAKSDEEARQFFSSGSFPGEQGTLQLVNEEGKEIDRKESKP